MRLLCTFAACFEPQSRNTVTETKAITSLRIRGTASHSTPTPTDEFSIPVGAAVEKTTCMPWVARLVPPQGFHELHHHFIAGIPANGLWTVRV